ncbi:TetR/AcrR family transcriptional regulator [Streptomyces sp. NPDC002701]|uniref:TetR/AcrR family transcriptional regulator n=1 Tax=unclassified Streptomyces TaxID=2593676 RepID=UPI0036B533B7
MGAVKSKRMPRAVREQQMLDAAVRTFGQRGYRAASMDEIADLAGVSKPLVYLYLNSKEDLFTACIRREAAALTAAVRAGVRPDLPADRQLWEGLLAFFTHTARNPDGWAVLHLQARTHGEPFAAEITSMREEIVAFVTQLIVVAAREAHRDPSLPEREVAGLAEALVGAAESLAAWANTTPAVSARQAAATLMNFAWAGLGDLMEGRPWEQLPEAAARP